MQLSANSLFKYLEFETIFFLNVISSSFVFMLCRVAEMAAPSRARFSSLLLGRCLVEDGGENVCEVSEFKTGRSVRFGSHGPFFFKLYFYVLINKTKSLLMFAGWKKVSSLFVDTFVFVCFVCWTF